MGNLQGAYHGCVYATTTTPGLLFYIPAQCKQGWLPGLSCLGAKSPFHYYANT